MHYARWKKYGDPLVTMSHQEIGRLGARVRNAPGFWYHWLIRSVCTSTEQQSLTAVAAGENQCQRFVGIEQPSSGRDGAKS